MDMDARDTRFMTAALRQAQAAAEAGEAPIGAVLVDPETDEIIAEAHNRPIGLQDPTGHAEILVLRAAALRSASATSPRREPTTAVLPLMIICGV